MISHILTSVELWILSKSIILPSIFVQSANCCQAVLENGQNMAEIWPSHNVAWNLKSRKHFYYLALTVHLTPTTNIILQVNSISKKNQNSLDSVFFFFYVTWVACSILMQFCYIIRLKQIILFSLGWRKCR